jgi:hypothetical protein
MGERLVSLDDLEPSLRFEVENGSEVGGKPTWAVFEDGKLDVNESVARLTKRVDGLKERAEIMNARWREEMRYSGFNDPGFPDRDLLLTAEYLTRFADMLETLQA